MTDDEPTAGGGGPPEEAPSETAMDALPEVAAENIRRRLAERRMSQKRLAKRLGRTEATVSRWLNRQAGVPLGQLVRIADVLHLPMADLFAGQAGPLEDAQLLNERLLHLLADRMEAQTRETQALRAAVRAVHLYRTGARGDPRAGEGDPEAARPTSFAYRPPGTEQTVGPRGFAVVVDGDEVAGRGVRPGDVVYCNPDAPWADGSLVAVGLGGGGPDDRPGTRPLALRTLTYGPGRTLDARTAPEEGPPQTHPSGAYVVYGPLVLVLTVARLPEGRGHAEEVRRHGPGPTREDEGGTPVVTVGTDAGGDGRHDNPLPVRP